MEEKNTESNNFDSQLNNNIEYNNNENQILSDNDNNKIAEKQNTEILRLCNVFSNIPSHILDMLNTDKHYDEYQYRIIEETYNIVMDKNRLQLIFDSKNNDIIEYMNQAFEAIFHVITNNKKMLFHIPFGLPITKAKFFYNNDNTKISFNMLRQCNKEIELTRNNILSIIDYIKANQKKLIERQGDEKLYNNLLDFLAHSCRLFDHVRTKQLLASYKKQQTELFQNLKDKINTFTELADQIRKVQIIRYIKKLEK